MISNHHTKTTVLLRELFRTFKLPIKASYAHNHSWINVTESHLFIVSKYLRKLKLLLTIPKKLCHGYLIVLFWLITSRCKVVEIYYSDWYYSHNLLHKNENARTVWCYPKVQADKEWEMQRLQSLTFWLYVTFCLHTHVTICYFINDFYI